MTPEIEVTIGGETFTGNVTEYEIANFTDKDSREDITILLEHGGTINITFKAMSTNLYKLVTEKEKKITNWRKIIERGIKNE